MTDIRRCLVVALILAAMLFALCSSGEAQQTGKILRIGFLDPSTASGSAGLLEAFWQEMRKLGWIEGKNSTTEYRFAEGKSERMSGLAADLVRLKVDLIVVTGTPTALAAKKATTTIPIVMTTVGDPVAAGLIASLARPGGNVTGLSTLGTELNSKRLEVLKDAVPKLVRIGLLRLPRQSASLQLKEIRPAATPLKLTASGLSIFSRKIGAGDVRKQRLGRSWRSYIIRPEFSCDLPSRRRSNGQSPQGNQAD